MRLVKAIVTTIAVLGILAVFAAPARADDNEDGRWRRRDWHEHHRRDQVWHGYDPPPVVYVQPRYYEAPPAYYAPPPAVYYVPPQVYRPPGLSIWLNFR